MNPTRQQEQADEPGPFEHSRGLGVRRVAGLVPPEGLNDDAAWWLRLFLRTQAFNMAEGDQQFRAQQQRGPFGRSPPSSVPSSRKAHPTTDGC